MELLRVVSRVGLRKSDDGRSLPVLTAQAALLDRPLPTAVASTAPRDAGPEPSSQEKAGECVLCMVSVM